MRVQVVFIVITSLFLSGNCIGQLPPSSKASFTWGETMQLKFFEVYLDVIGRDGSDYIVLKRTKKMEYFLQRFDKDLNLVKSTELPLKYKKKKLRLEKVVLFNGSLLLLESFVNREHKVNYLICEELDLGSLTAVGEMKKIAEVKYEKQKSKGSFELISSRDGMKQMVFYRKLLSKGGAEKYGFVVLNNQAEIENASEIEIPFTKDFFRVESVKLSNDGKVYLLGA